MDFIGQLLMITVVIFITVGFAHFLFLDHFWMKSWYLKVKKILYWFNIIMSIITFICLCILGIGLII